MKGKRVATCEKCESLAREVTALSAQNIEMASQTVDRLTLCCDVISSLKDSIESLESQVEGQKAVIQRLHYGTEIGGAARVPDLRGTCSSQKTSPLVASFRSTTSPLCQCSAGSCGCDCHVRKEGYSSGISTRIYEPSFADVERDLRELEDDVSKVRGTVRDAREAFSDDGGSSLILESLLGNVRDTTRLTS